MLSCLQCSPSAPTMRTAPSQALTHLAAHARHDFLPRHLRTCQCHSHGCRWHPRHRGCAGPVLLVLTRERGGRLWRLADTCAACAAATDHAAVVPDTVLATASPAASVKRIRQRQRRRAPHGLSEQVRVREMLSYLAAALPARTSAPARLLALQCALRSTTAGKVNIPTGLLRGMRIASEPSAFTELEAAGWLRPPTGPTHAGVSMELLDTAVRMQAPARADRARAANWILLICQMSEIRQLGATPRLLALALAAHPRTKQARQQPSRKSSRACAASRSNSSPPCSTCSSPRASCSPGRTALSPKTCAGSSPGTPTSPAASQALSPTV